MGYTDLCVQTGMPLRDAMHQLEEAGPKILFICSGSALIGSLTDGDIRRFLLKGGRMDAAVSQAANLHPKTAKNLSEARKLLEDSSYLAVPIINAANDLLDIVLPLKQDHLMTPQLGIPVVIMAGGKGTRLDPYTRVLPKPLIPIGELPIIEHIMRRFVRYGCSSFHIIINYKKQLMKAYFNESSRKYDVTWYEEEHPLGTGGGLYLLKEQFKSTFFLTNCDILLHSDYASMIKFHRDNGNVITMVGAYKSYTIPYGVVELGEEGVIASIQEKPEYSFLANTGMYIIEPSVLDALPDNTVISFPEILKMQLEQGNRVAVYPVDGEEWMDMGQLDELREMEDRLRSKGDLE